MYLNAQVFEGSFGPSEVEDYSLAARNIGGNRSAESTAAAIKGRRVFFQVGGETPDPLRK
jgi:hypothetical protein